MSYRFKHKGGKYMNEKTILVRVTLEKPVEGSFQFEDGVYHLNRLTADDTVCIYKYIIERVIYSILIKGQNHPIRTSEDLNVLVHSKQKTTTDRVIPLHGITSIETIEEIRSVKTKPLNPYCREYVTKNVTIERTNPGTYVDIEITYTDNLDVAAILNQGQFVCSEQTFVVEVIKDETEITEIDKEIAELKHKIYELEKRKALLQ